MTKELLSPQQADNKMNDFLSTPVTKKIHSPKMNAVSKERFSNLELQKQMSEISPVSRQILPSKQHLHSITRLNQKIIYKTKSISITVSNYKSTTIC